MHELPRGSGLCGLWEHLNLELYMGSSSQGVLKKEKGKRGESEKTIIVKGRDI